MGREYRCPECKTIWVSYDDAKECCAPKPTEVFTCDTCGKICRTEDEAEEHCKERRK